MNDSFKKELAVIRDKILKQGRKLEDVYEELQNEELANFVLKILLGREEIYKEYKLKNDALDYTVYKKSS